MRRLIVGLVLSLLLATSASAGPILSGIVNGVAFCATDNNTACGPGQLLDLDPNAGSLQLGNVTLGGVTVNSSTHTQTIAGTQNSLNSQSLQVINNTGGTVSAEVSIGGVGYTGPITQIDNSGSGTWQNALGSSISMSWYADAANQQGGEAPNDHPGTLLATFADVAGAGVDSFSTGSLLVGFLDPDLFSMTTSFSMNLIAGGQLISRGQNMIANPSAVPEPASMLLLGTGLMAAFRARRKKVV